MFEETVRIIAGTLKPGEACTCSVASVYAFGGDGCQELGINPGDALNIDLELLEIVKDIGPEDDNPEARIAAAEEAKSRANQVFKTGNTEEALASYSRVLTILEQDYNWHPDLKQSVQRLRSRVHS